MGEHGARIALYFYLTNGFFNAYIIRTFSNSLETILHLVAFNYFLQISSKQDNNVKMVAFSLSIALVVRNSSPIGWVPLILIKIISERNFPMFLDALIRVAIPTLFIAIMIDSLYFGWFPTITAWNFFKVNVLENRSAEFGVSS